MLKSQQENAEQTPPLSVAQARVTPEELSQALAAIEARKQAEASRLAGTIPIEEAVSSLHLDSTPDEIWAEVQAQRAKAEAERTPAVNPTFAAADAARREQLRQTQPFQSSAVLAAIVPQKRQRDRRWMNIFTPFILIWILAQVGVIPQFWNHHPQLPHFSQHTPHVAQMTTLNHVPDGKEVYVNSVALMQIVNGIPATQITVDQNPGTNRWKVLNQSGHVYLRGSILRADSLQSLQGQSLDVYNDNNSGELDGEKTSNIQLRIDEIPPSKFGGNDDYSEITIPNFQADSLTTLSDGG